ncbi:MAG: tannase/feruloyl esterase family alpha/beta hydrolase [Acidisphaera sp.]|nr:tannase/feruloyl esterase family alpha/beta hydrolase [Acidisphaera sp.]
MSKPSIMNPDADPPSPRAGLGNLRTGVVAAALLATTSLIAHPAFAQVACSDLTSLRLPDNTVITTAQDVPAGSFTPPGSTTALTGLPEFCRVAGTISPTADSDIGFEVWLPTTTWNGKYEGTGNGGLAGSIVYSALQESIQHGFAGSNTDTGHNNANGAGAFALGHPQKIIDFGYRSTHLTAVISKLVVAAFYGKAASESYFNGCSQGGQEALMEAQRFPNDYNGIVAGDPDNYMTHHEVGAHLWVTLNEFGPNDNGVLQTADLQPLGDAVNAVCDAQDGLADGILNDPLTCHFNPSVLLCQNGNTTDCLTAQQVQTVKAIYNGPDSVTYAGYYPGFLRGGEATNWPGYISALGPDLDVHSELGLPFFKYFVFQDPNWDFHTWQFTPANLAMIDQRFASILNAVNPNLRPFKNAGGKLIQFHGFADPDVPPLNSINYYNSVVSFFSDANSGNEEVGKSKVDSFYRLFMVPGMGHCGGGNAPNVFNGSTQGAPMDPQHDIVLALDQWVTNGTAPNQIIATQYAAATTAGAAPTVVRTRPLCPWPLLATWTHKGSEDNAASFTCAPPTAKQLTEAEQQ